ncbi:hypothetical protein BT69DRAFT_148522 [Atractiella rhizophila]|nr:hypothetical protein BT69DRAFT_148522 [Atractiella rhizophila]
MLAHPQMLAYQSFEILPLPFHCLTFSDPSKNRAICVHSREKEMQTFLLVLRPFTTCWKSTG